MWGFVGSTPTAPPLPRLSAFVSGPPKLLVRCFMEFLPGGSGCGLNARAAPERRIETPIAAATMAIDLDIVSSCIVVVALVTARTEPALSWSLVAAMAGKVQSSCLKPKFPACAYHFRF